MQGFVTHWLAKRAGGDLGREPLVEKRCQIKVHFNRRSALFFALLALLPVRSSSAVSQTSDQTVDRLERVSSFAFGGIGFVSATSQGEIDYRAILSRKSAAADFDTIFRTGNPQAKCYALTGLRQVNPSRFDMLAAPLQWSRTCVAVTRGCQTFSRPTSDIVKQIRLGIYSGPLTRDLVPPPDAGKPHTPSQEQTEWLRLFTLFFSRSSKPDPPAPPPGPPPPPPKTFRLRSVCIAE
jgi:hypothetical protein